MTQNMEALARLIRQQATFYGWTVETLAHRAGVGARTAAAWLAAENTPSPSFRSRLENALDWSSGTVSEVLASEAGRQWSLADVQGGPSGIEALSDRQLVDELARRLGLLA